MSRLGIRARFALLTAALVFAIAALVGTAGYLALSHSLLTRAQTEARDQARQLVALIDVGGEGGNTQQGNQVDVRDPSLTSGFTRGGLLVAVLRPDGSRIQATAGMTPLPSGMRPSCVRAGHAQARTGQLALACARAGPARRPAALVAVGAPLRDATQALGRLAQALALGVALGTLLAAALARAAAERALRPARRIAQAARSIQAGDLSRRIAYQGPRDELGELADVLDASFAELHQAVERQRRFVADASHELRTPLAAIQAHVELLTRWAGASPAARESALSALDQASRAAGRLGADLLYLAQLDRPPPPQRAPTQLDQTVVDAVREARALRPEIPIRITQLDETLLDADELGLRRLLVNLLANALRISPPTAEVTVELASDGQTATVTVTDDGPGIPCDQLDHIFEPFHTTAPRGSGNSGLGLAIARDIADRHHGELHAGNRPGGGAAFELRLPLHKTLTEPAPASP